MAENSKQEGLSLDSLLPPAIAAKVENIGVKKANMDATSMFMLAILAGAFIGFGAIFCTTVVTGIGDKVGFGLAKLIGGLVFSLGLILVIIAGAELFTGNNLPVMAAASGKVPLSKLLRNWGIVYLGNFVGSILTAYNVSDGSVHDGQWGPGRDGDEYCRWQVRPGVCPGIDARHLLQHPGLPGRMADLQLPNDRRAMTGETASIIPSPADWNSSRT